jgi:hypothetical protein
MAPYVSPVEMREDWTEKMKSSRFIFHKVNPFNRGKKIPLFFEKRKRGRCKII